jgi:hypothetical protein
MTTTDNDMTGVDETTAGVNGDSRCVASHLEPQVCFFFLSFWTILTFTYIRTTSRTKDNHNTITNHNNIPTSLTLRHSSPTTTTRCDDDCHDNDTYDGADDDYEGQRWRTNVAMPPMSKYFFIYCFFKTNFLLGSTTTKNTDRDANDEDVLTPPATRSPQTRVRFLFNIIIYIIYLNFRFGNVNHNVNDEVVMSQ